jgi:ABC-type nitrate/sulfonate/bicarbonate transport system substrate-binding protein
MKRSNPSQRFGLSTLKLLLLSAAFFAMIDGACRAQAAEMPTLRANYAAISGAFAPLWIAADRNLFAKYGLNVDLRYIAPATATQALIGRNLDIINPGGEIVEAGLNGEPVVYVAGILNRAVMSIYAKPEISSLVDLKGKVLGLTVPGATTDFAARVLLQQARLTPGKDVKLLYMKGMPEILAGIVQGNAEAGIFTSPTTLKAQHAGLKELVNVTEQNIPMIHAALATTKEYLKTRPDNARRFLQAYLEGIKVARTDADFTKQMIAKYTKTNDPSDLENSYQTFLPAWERLPVVPPAAVQTMLNFASHPAAKATKPESLIDNSVLLELGKSGFVDRLYK